MCLAAVPAYRLARMLVSPRSAVVCALLTIAIPAMSYATFIIPEPFAYLWFTATAYCAVRALAAPRPLTVVTAVVLAAAGPLVRSEFVVLPTALAFSAALLWVLRGDEARRRFRRIALACAALALGGYLFNRFVVMHVQSWNTSQYFNHHTLGQGSVAAGALAIGLGIGPVIGGLASLWLPERFSDPAYRAHAVYLGSAIVTCSVYTAAKATYVQELASLQNLIEERNMFYLSPLLLIGTATVLQARKVNWYAIGAATALVLVVVWSNRLEVGAPYYEAPGLAIPTLLNRTFVFTVQDVHAVLIAAAAVAIALIAMRRRRWAAPVAAVLAGAWLLTGEIYETKSDIDKASGYAGNLAPPRTWVDASTHRAPTTFLGVQLNDAAPEWLTEFWNRSIDHVYALDDSAPPPGPIVAPYLLSTDGALADYTGNRYTVARPRLRARRPGRDATWRLHALQHADTVAPARRAVPRHLRRLGNEPVQLRVPAARRAGSRDGRPVAYGIQRAGPPGARDHRGQDREARQEQRRIDGQRLRSPARRCWQREGDDRARPRALDSSGVEGRRPADDQRVGRPEAPRGTARVLVQARRLTAAAVPGQTERQRWSGRRAWKSGGRMSSRGASTIPAIESLGLPFGAERPLPPEFEELRQDWLEAARANDPNAPMLLEQLNDELAPSGLSVGSGMETSAFDLARAVEIGPRIWFQDERPG